MEYNKLLATDIDVLVYQCTVQYVYSYMYMYITMP